MHFFFFLLHNVNNYVCCSVCGLIVPWNYPLMMLAWKISPLLAAGNTVVLKPAQVNVIYSLFLHIKALYTSTWLCLIEIMRNTVDSW